MQICFPRSSGEVEPNSYILFPRQFEFGCHTVPADSADFVVLISFNKIKIFNNLKIATDATELVQGIF
jgi:hypothetical protein